MSEELKSCPFCGKLPTATIQIESSFYKSVDGYIDFVVKCECGIQKASRLKVVRGETVFFDVDKKMSEIKKAWNRRTE